MNRSHPNSKIVQIIRTESFMDLAQTQAKEFMSMSRKSIGSYWKNSQSKVIGSGLDYNEQDLLMPLVIDSEPGDRQFREKVSKYFKEILTSVPFGDIGRELEIGLVLDNSKPVTYTDKDGLRNMPINETDYIRYRHALSHPQVASSKEAAVGDPLKTYYIYDPEVADKVLVATTKTADEAMSLYLSIKEKKDKIDGMLILFGVDPRDFSGPSADAQRAKKLREFAETKAEDFIKHYRVDHFELRTKIKAFIQNGIFKMVGDRIFEASTSVMVAKDMDDCVKLLLTEEYNEKLTIWSANLTDIKAKPKNARRKPVA